MASREESKPLGLRIKGNCYQPYVIGGGDVPKNMRTLFTSVGAAQKALDEYELSKPPCKRFKNRKVILDGEDID